MSADAYSWFVVVSGLKNKALADGCFSAKPKTIYSSITMVTRTHLITRFCLIVMLVKKMMPADSVVPAAVLTEVMLFTD